MPFSPSVIKRTYLALSGRLLSEEEWFVFIKGQLTKLGRQVVLLNAHHATLLWRAELADKKKCAKENNLITAKREEAEIEKKIG